MKVLLVDDDSTTLAILERRLETRGHEVQSRTEAIGTTRAIDSFEPDIVVLDVGMPAVNGDQLAKVIRRKHVDIKIVLLSDRPDEELRTLAMSCRASGFLHKRDSDRLAELLEGLLADDRG